MRARGAAAGLALALLLAAPTPSRAEPPSAPAPKPFPVDRTQKLQEDGAVYTVEGRVRIPKGVEISVFKGSTIRGIGSTPAVIEVEGGLDLVGVQGLEVLLEDVTVQPTGDFEGIRFETVTVKGKGGVRTDPEGSANGEILLELTDFVKPAAVDLAFRGGRIVLSSLCVETPVRLRAVDPDPAKRNKVEVIVRNCRQGGKYHCPTHGTLQGLLAGLSVDGAAEVSVVGSRIAGEMTSLKNWRGRLLLDGAKFSTRKIEIVNTEAGLMSKVQCVKCDFYVEEIWVCAPPKEGLRDAFIMDRCFFRGFEEAADVLAKRIRDGDDLSAVNGARVLLGKVSPKANALAGPAE